MAVNFTELRRGNPCAENNAEDAGTGQPASPQRPCGVVIRSVSERQPGLVLLGNAASGQRDATAPGSPDIRTAGQVGRDLSDTCRPNSSVPTMLLRRIDRLTGDDEPKSGRSLLRLHGNEGICGNDTLAPLRITWLVSVDEPVAPGELSRATPPPGSMPPVSAPPSVPGGAAPRPRTMGEMTAAEAFFRYPGPGATHPDYGQWVMSHPLFRMFDQVYPRNDAVSAPGYPLDTPLYIVLRGGIHEPLGFYQSLMQLSERTDNDFPDRPSVEFETLFHDAVAVSRKAHGLLREQADFFSRLFSVVLALRVQTEVEEKARIIEVLRQEWLETDFSTLSAPMEVKPPEAHGQAAEPVRTQVSGRRTLADALGHGDMSPRKRQKTDHHREASTAAGDERLALARQTPDSPRHASPRTSDTDGDAERSPSPETERSPVRTRLSWKSTALKRKAGMAERPFKAWLANLSARGVSASSGPAPQSSAQLISDPPVAGAAITPAQPQENPLSN